mmetsp:Transcript_60432/g.89655  ORF Transcript_60432/g.89655 Transcript_60432/m.89655 type:complete len:375 (+) Transcript_60432:139-1263(+)
MPSIHRIVVDLSNQTYVPKDETLAKDLGSEEDMKQVTSNPLPRALYCLERAIGLCSAPSPLRVVLSKEEEEDGNKEEEMEDKTNIEEEEDVNIVNGTSLLTSPSNKKQNRMAVDEDCLEATRTALAYVKLEMNDPVMALQLCRLVLSNPVPTTNSSSDWSRAVSLRRRATVRMYACEAISRVGNANDAMNFMLYPGSSKEDKSKDMEDYGDDDVSGAAKAMKDLATLNDLARELVMLPTAASGDYNNNDHGDGNNIQQQMRFNEARIATQVSASGAAASAGDTQTANRYAALAFQHVSNSSNNVVVGGPSNASSSSYSSSSNSSSRENNGGSSGGGVGGGASIISKRMAKKALMYCLLRKGDNENALAVLRSGP